MNHLHTFESFLNEAYYSDIIESILSNLGFVKDRIWKGNTTNMKYAQVSSTEEKWYHPNVDERYSISLLKDYRYMGFYIWDDEKNSMYYIWKRKAGDLNKEKAALTKVATNMSKGKLPKANPDQIEKHYNS